MCLKTSKGWEGLLEVSFFRVRRFWTGWDKVGLEACLGWSCLRMEKILSITCIVIQEIWIPYEFKYIMIYLMLSKLSLFLWRSPELLMWSTTLHFHILASLPFLRIPVRRRIYTCQPSKPRILPYIPCTPPLTRWPTSVFFPPPQSFHPFLTPVKLLSSFNFLTDLDIHFSNVDQPSPLFLSWYPAFLNFFLFFVHSLDKQLSVFKLTFCQPLSESPSYLMSLILKPSLFLVLFLSLSFSSSSSW